MPVKFMHDWTHSFNKDKVTNQKLQNCTNTMGILFQWWDLPNEGVSIAVQGFVIFPHVYSLGVHFYLLIPEMNKDLGLFTTSKASNSLFPLEIRGNVWQWNVSTLIEFSQFQTKRGDFELRDF